MELHEKDFFKHKRIVAIDYGLKRIGLAVTDIFHISLTPLKTIDRSKDSYFDDILIILENENSGAVVVGVPYRLDGEETDLIKEIKLFIEKLKSKISIPVIPYDESFSTVRTTETMIEIGKRKKKRSTKGEKDKIAAAIILREFLQEID